MTLDLTTEPLGMDPSGAPVYLRDLWPAEREIRNDVEVRERPDVSRAAHGRLQRRRPLEVVARADRRSVHLGSESTYIRNPPFFEVSRYIRRPCRTSAARALALLGDSITTDHISPAGSIKRDSPAGKC